MCPKIYFFFINLLIRSVLCYALSSVNDYMLFFRILHKCLSGSFVILFFHLYVCCKCFSYVWHAYLYYHRTMASNHILHIHWMLLLVCFVFSIIIWFFISYQTLDTRMYFKSHAQKQKPKIIRKKNHENQLLTDYIVTLHSNHIFQSLYLQRFIYFILLKHKILIFSFLFAVVMIFCFRSAPFLTIFDFLQFFVSISLLLLKNTHHLCGGKFYFGIWLNSDQMLFSLLFFCSRKRGI